jgi:geranylgeranyl pyrophosphate synthase
MVLSIHSGTGANKLVNKWYLIKENMDLVEEQLKLVLESSVPEIKTVGDYVVRGKGKRIRPALFLLAAQRNGQDLSSFSGIAVALELLHTASLLHDDVIDQAEIRRGKETVHLRWNNKIAVLSGDFILSQVFKILVENKHWQLMDIVVNMTQKLAEGEVEQAFTNIDSQDLEQHYFSWIGKKSASFFAGCCEAGSLLGGDDPDQQKVWSSFGYNLGIAFQLVDDLLDYTGSDRLTGKPLYGDLRNRVMTLPLIRAINEIHGKDKITLDSFLRDDSCDSETLSSAAEIVCRSSGIEYTRNKAEYYAEMAIRDVQRLKQISSEKRTILEDITRELMSRRK